MPDLMTNRYPIILREDIEPVVSFSLINGTKYHKKGPIEDWISKKLFFLGVDFLRNDIAVSISGHVYEPDYVYINADNGIYVDIEIDEPYTWGGKPCHYIDQNGFNSDDRRNRLFVSAGWTVVRFSEKQIFSQTKSSIGCLAKIIAEIDDSFGNDHSMMLSWGEPTNEPAWTYSESMQMAECGTREQYLGFKPGRINLKEILDFSRHEIASILAGRWLQ